MIVLNGTGEELVGLPTNFPFPNIKDKLYFSKKIAYTDGTVVGGGIVKLTCEGILILDENLDIRSRAIASRRIIEELRIECKRLGLEDCHVFVKQQNVKNFLYGLGFRDCIGEALVIDL
jgi:hypothetical protein